MNIKSTDIGTVYRISLRHDSFTRSFYLTGNIKICLILSGEGLWQLDDTLITVRTNDIILLNNHTRRIFRKISESESLDMLVFEFPPGLYGADFYPLYYAAGIKNSLSLPPDDDILSLMHSIYREFTDKKAYHKMLIYAKGLELLSLLSRHYLQEKNDCHELPARIRQAMNFIDSHYTSQITLEAAAEYVSLSPAALSRQFHRFLGIGFARYVMTKRIDLAIMLLQTTENSILSIAMDCGYRNTASFYKAFRKITGTVPAAFRHSDSQNNI